MKMDMAQMEAIHTQLGTKLKMRMVKINKGPIDMNPLLVVTFDNHRHYVGKAIPSQMGEDFRLGRAVAYDTALLWAGNGQRPIERIISVCDGYIHLVDTPEEVATIQHGDLGEDFRTNPATKIKEGIITTFLWVEDDEVRCQTLTSVYRFGEGGVLQWDERKTSDAELLTRENCADLGAVVDSAYAVMMMTRSRL